MRNRMCRHIERRLQIGDDSTNSHQRSSWRERDLSKMSDEEFISLPPACPSSASTSCFPQRTSQMKWTPDHDVMLGKEVMLFELWKFKPGSRERGQCLDRIAESLNELQKPFFNVSQKSIRDRLKILERDFKKKDGSEKKASGISPEKSEVDEFMEEYLERREEQEKQSETTCAEGRDKATKDKASAEEMRNQAMERLAETKKRAGDDPPRKKRKQSCNETMDFLKEAAEKECELKKEELEFRKKQEESALTQQNQMFQQQQQMTKQFQEQQQNQQQQFQMMCQMFFQQQQQQNQAMLELLKKQQ